MTKNPITLPTPHGFLISNGKQTAIAAVNRLDIAAPSLIVSNGEAFGVATLDQPAQIALKEFDTQEWQQQHRITPRERRQWWPDATSFYVYRLKAWEPFDGIKLYEDGELIDEPKLTAAQWKLVSESRELPKQITLIQDAVSVTDRKEFVINKAALSEELLEILAATYDQEIITAKEAKELIPVYSLALIRQPRMRVSKKNIIAEATDELKEVSKAKKTEGNKMPYAIVRQDDEFCVINADTEEIEDCHDTQEDAEAHLTALNLNVMVDEDGEEIVAEGEGAACNEPKKPKPKPKKPKPNKSATTTEDTEFVDGATAQNDAAPSGTNETIDDTAVVEFTIPNKEPDAVDEPDEEIEFFVSKEFDDSSWDGSASQWDTADEYCSDCLIDLNPAGGEKVKEFCKLPYRKPGTKDPNKGALRAIAGGRGITAVEKPPDVPENEWEAKKREAANRLIGWWPDAFGQPAPESVFEIAGKTRPKKSFMSTLRAMYKGLADFFTLMDGDDTQEVGEFDKEFSTDAGFTQKIVNGEVWHYTWSTNAFEDRDKEIFSTKGLEDYVAANEQHKNKGTFNLWHINAEDGNFNTDFAIKKWQGVVGRFLVEAGPYTRDEKGRAARKFFKKYAAGHSEIAPEGWGCSPEFKYLPEERETGIYKNIWITRTSTLPKMAAANLWTQTRQYKRGAKMALSDEQYRAAVSMFGGDFVKDMMNEGQIKTAELEAAGVAHKSVADVETETAEEVSQDVAVDETEAAKVEVETTEVDETAEGVEEPQTPSVNKIEFTQEQFDALAANVANHVKVDQTSVVEAMAILAEGVKNIETRVKAIEAKDEAKAKATIPTYTIGLMQRASETEVTQVADDDDLKSKKPVGSEVKIENVTPTTFFKT